MLMLFCELFPPRVRLLFAERVTYFYSFPERGKNGLTSEKLDMLDFHDPPPPPHTHTFHTFTHPILSLFAELLEESMAKTDIAD